MMPIDTKVFYQKRAKNKVNLLPLSIHDRGCCHRKCVLPSGEVEPFLIRAVSMHHWPWRLADENDLVSANMTQKMAYIS